MRVTIVGPNLPRNTSQHHVHAEGCADLKRGWIREYVENPPYTIDVDSRLEVESDIYYFSPDETPDYVLGEFQSEFHFAPCCDNLPLS